MVKCPYNDVMSFIYRYKGTKNNEDIKILELGSGDGNNVWFLKKEGFDIKGIELDENRIKNCMLRLEHDNLKAEIARGSFCELPFLDGEFDIVFDRAAVTCVNNKDAYKAVMEVNRVLKKGGFFYFNPYSEFNNEIFNGEILEDGRVGSFNQDTKRFNTYEGIEFYSIKDVLKMFKNNLWNIKEFNIVEKKELIKSRNFNCSMFEVVVEKK